MGGRADFTASGSGTLQEPVINAAIHVHDLPLTRSAPGTSPSMQCPRVRRFEITGQSQFEQADLKVEGNVHCRGDWPADVYFRFHQLDLDSVLRIYLQRSVTGHSRADGEVHMVGPLRRPRELQFTANLDNLDASVEDLKIQNEGPVRFSVANQVLQD